MGRLRTPDVLTQCDARKAVGPDAAQRKSYTTKPAREMGLGVPFLPSQLGTSPLRAGKQRVGLAHDPIGNEADPLLRGPVELDQRCGAGSEKGKWT